MTDTTETANLADIQAALKSAQDSIAKLEAKNKQLLEEKNKTRSEAEAAKAAAEEAEEAQARAANNLQALEASLTKKYQKQIDDLTAKLSETEGNLRTQLIDNALTAKMVEHNVSPALQPALMAMLKGQAKLEGTEAIIEGKPLADYMADFVCSDQGKAFVLAPSNTGSGATGGSGSSSRMTKENFNMTEFLKIAESSPAEADALAESLGMPHLKG